MKEQARAFCERLGVEFYEELVPYFKEASELPSAITEKMLDTERILALEAEYGFLRDVADDVIGGIELIAEDDDLVLFNKILYCIIKDGKRTGRILPTPAGVDKKTDFSPAPAVLFFIEDAVELLKKRRLPHDIISDSLWGIGSEICAYRDMHGRYGMRDYLDWYLYFIRAEIIRVGRLQYQFVTFGFPVRVFTKGDEVAIMMNGVEMHRGGMQYGALGYLDEKEKYFADVKVDGDKVTGYRADRYGEVAPTPVTIEGFDEPLKAGDNVIAIHITNGEPFSFELIEESFARADKIWEEYYPDLNIKGYQGYSWVFNKHLRDIMGRDTNITRLADLFEIFPTRGGHHGIFEYVFACPESTPLSDLPERTSMQRGIKKYLMDGHYFNEMAGVRLLRPKK